MITLTRRNLHQFRVVAKKALSITRGPGPPVELESSSDQLLVRTRSQEAAAEFRLPGEFSTERIRVPWEFLDTCQAKKDEPISLALEQDKVVVQWQDGSLPQVVQYDLPEPPGEESLPTPAEMAENPSDLLRALAYVCTVTDPESSRYTLSCVQLDGDAGSVAATDGRQVLMQTGFVFPWEGPVLLPARKLFSCPQLSSDERGLIGRTKDWLTMQTGPWTFHFCLNIDGRFPRVDDVIPSDCAVVASLRVSDADAAFLVDNIKRLPASDDVNRPVTLDLNGEVVVRARKDDGQPVTELALVNSVRSGDVVRINTNRDYLAHALKLGFRQISIVGPGEPVFCRAEERTYVWATLDGDVAIPSTDNPHRIESPKSPVSKAVAKAKPTRSRIAPMSGNSANGNGNGNGRTGNGRAKPVDTEVVSPIEQAEALRDVLKDSLDKTRALVRALKQQKKQSRIVESTLASLRQLQSVDL